MDSACFAVMTALTFVYFFHCLQIFDLRLFSPFLLVDPWKLIKIRSNWAPVSCFIQIFNDQNRIEISLYDAQDMYEILEIIPVFASVGTFRYIFWYSHKIIKFSKLHFFCVAPELDRDRTNAVSNKKFIAPIKLPFKLSMLIWLRCKWIRNVHRFSNYINGKHV